MGAGAMLLGVALRAAPPPSISSAPPQMVTYNAGAAQFIHARRMIEMSQGVTFEHEGAVLKTEAAAASLDSAQNLVSAKSLAPVHLYDPENDLTGQQGFIDFPRHLATLKDNVTLIVKPGAREATAPAGSLRSRFKDAATLSCEAMTYDYRSKIGRVPGKLTIRQKDRVLTADSGTYNTKTQTVTLVGNVRGQDGDGNVIQASRAVMGIKEGDEYITIPVPTHGQFRVKEEADQPDNGPPTSPPVAAQSSAQKTSEPH